MLAADGLLEALSKEENTDSYKNCNDDHDFGRVLDFYSSDIDCDKGKLLRYSDGKERVFSFDN